MTREDLLKKAEELLESRRQDVLEILADMIYNDNFDIVLSDVYYEVDEEKQESLHPPIL